MSKCKKCKILNKLFKNNIKSDYEYWLFTEMFVYLHKGKDYCNNKPKKPKPLKVRKLYENESKLKLKYEK